VIFYYTKTSKFFFKPYYQPYLKGHVDGYFKKSDEHGRYWTNSIHGAGLRNGESGKSWRGYDPSLAGRHWAVPSDLVLQFGIDPDLPQHEKLDALADLGLIDFPALKPGNLPTYRQYLDRSPGAPIQDIWAYQPHTKGMVYNSNKGIDDDVRWIGKQGDKERLGYDTQKPEGLLERIINASCAPDGTVLDAYCGCGTTVAVAQRLGRRWIGIDITYQSIALILKRFRDSYEKAGTWAAVEANIILDGVPKDIESAMALANKAGDKTRKEFEKWAILSFSDNQARINEKKGADGGIDGIAYFLIDKDSNGKAIFQVKSSKGSRGDLATLNNDRIREKAEFGFLICTGLPTPAMQAEIAAAGKYKHPLLNREDDRLQVITVAELFDHPGRPARRLDLPMARGDAVKSAPAVVDDNQGKLGL
jgi:SAM-dependent methyltransferase